MPSRSDVLRRFRALSVTAAAALVASMLSMVVLASPTSAILNPTFSGTVTGPNGAIGGAIVVLEGNGSAPQSAISAADGTFSITDAAATYSLVAQAPGYQLFSQSGVVVPGGGVTGYSVSLTASVSTLRPLPVDGCQCGAVRAGGPGVFYVSTPDIPQIFRTVDYGGTWSPVTVAYDGGSQGLPSNDALAGDSQDIATSQYPGDVAILLPCFSSCPSVNAWSLYVSQDYGVTWALVGSVTATGAGDLDGVSMGWGHSGSADVILINAPTGNYIVDMTQATPSIQLMTAPYMQPSDVFAVANGASGPFLAVASVAGGAVDVYALTNSLTSPLGVILAYPTGFPGSGGAPQQVFFGGTSSGSAPPSMFVVTSSATNGPTFAGTKASGATSYTASAVHNAVASNGMMQPCYGNFGPYDGSIDPTSNATGPIGLDALVGNCYMTLSAATPKVPAFSQDNGAINNNTAFDTGFAGPSGIDQVAMSNGGGQGEGADKAAMFNASGPVFTTSQKASAGTGSGTGGISGNGITEPHVNGIALGPSPTQDVSAVLGTSDGGGSLASTDGGATFTPAVEQGGSSTSWWQGASHNWLTYGSGLGGMTIQPALSVRADWTAGSSPLANPNIPVLPFPLNSDFTVTSLAGLPGQDALFVGTANGNSNNSALGHVARLSLSGSGDAITATLAADTLTLPVISLQYCPAGSAPSVADALFVSSGVITNGGPSGTTGSLVKVSNASTTTDFSGTPTGIPTNDGPVQAVAVDCANGTVWAGTGNPTNVSVGDLYKSTDGGATFSVVSNVFGSFPGRNQATSNITAIAINPLNTAQVIVAAGQQGEISVTNDTGATWTIVNDPAGLASPPLAGSHNFAAQGVGALVINGAVSGALVRQAGPSALRSSSQPTGKALAPQTVNLRPASIVGTGSGLLTGLLASSSPSAPPKHVLGYWTDAADGGIFTFGQAQFQGSVPGILRPGQKLNMPVVGMAPTADGGGYWMDASDGGIFSFGNAQFHGSVPGILQPGQKLNKPVVGMAPTADGGGYWMVASDGGIFSFGDAKFYGSTGGIVLNKPIVGMAVTPDGKGYWMVASDGGIFSFGSAQFYGSMGNKTLNKPMVGMAPTAAGKGYWTDASDGGVFSFGDAQFHGSMGGTTLNKPMVGMASTPDGGGYWMDASDGGIFSFGNAQFYGSMGNKTLNAPMVGMATYAK